MYQKHLNWRIPSWRSLNFPKKESVKAKRMRKWRTRSSSRWTRRSAGARRWAHLKIESGSRETRQGRQAERTREKSPTDFRGQGYLGASGCPMFLSRKRARESAWWGLSLSKAARHLSGRTFFSSSSSTKRRLGPVVLEFPNGGPRRKSHYQWRKERQVRALYCGYSFSDYILEYSYIRTGSLCPSLW